MWYGIHMDKTESHTEDNCNHHKHRSDLLIELVSHILTPLCGPSTWKDSQGASWSTTRPAPSLGFSTRTIPHPCRYIHKSTCSQTTHVHICVVHIIVGSEAAQKWLSCVNCGSMFLTTENFTSEMAVWESETKCNTIQHLLHVLKHNELSQAGIQCSVS